MDTILLKSDGSIPTTDRVATQSNQFAFGVVDSVTHHLKVDASPAPAPTPAAGNVATFTEGTKTVAATGTPERLVGSATYVTSVLISPLRTNTGRVFVGVTLTNDTQCIEVPVVIEAPSGKSINLNLLYVDVSVNGEGVSYLTLS